MRMRRLAATHLALCLFTAVVHGQTGVIPSTPVPASLSPAALGDSQSAAYAWGNNLYGQLGNTTNNGNYNYDAVPTPTRVNGVSYVSALAAGMTHSLGLESNGSVYAWGDNNEGQLGNTTNYNTSAANPTPALVSGVSNVMAVAAGANHSLALESNGSVYVWGSNQYGQLGNSSGMATSPTPAPITGVGNVTALAAGYAHSLVLTRSGSVYAWGLNTYGQLGNANNNGNNNANPAPMQVSGLSGVTAVAAGSRHNLALANGNVYAWGLNSSGQLGTLINSGTYNANPTPTLVVGLSGVTTIASGFDHSLALVNGNVYAWGGDQYGQLGNGTTTTAANSTPTEVNYNGKALSGILSLAAGEYASYALASDGSLYVWGYNGAGELGIGNTTNQDTPYHLLPPAGQYYDAISSSGDSTFALAILGDAPPAVPEPSTWALLGVGAVGAGIVVWRRYARLV